MRVDDPGASGAGVRHVRVDGEHAGRRVDNFVNTMLGGVPRGRLYRMLRRGEVRVNGHRVGPDHRLDAGDEVRLPPFAPGRAGVPARAPSAQLVRRLQAAVVYEDESLIVLDKPAGLAVHGGSGLALGLIEAMQASWPDGKRLALVHRLDRDTSGCLALARTPSRLRALHGALRSGGIDKRYLALVAGQWPDAARTVNSRLQRQRGPGGSGRVTSSVDGKLAQSTFRVLERYCDATLVEVTIATGRTHQIRVHAAEAGHPIAGDEKYGSPELNRGLRALGLERLFLHASMLRLPGAVPGTEVLAHAGLPADLRAVLEAMTPLAAQ